MKLTTAEAAAILIDRGVLVRGKLPTARTVEHWCRTRRLSAERIGSLRRGLWQIDESELATFEAPVMGRKKAI